MSVTKAAALRAEGRGTNGGSELIGSGNLTRSSLTHSSAIPDFTHIESSHSQRLTYSVAIFYLNTILAIIYIYIYILTHIYVLKEKQV